jgi:hypothetical protein
MLNLPRFDADGSCIPFSAGDEIIEAALDDADYADPAEWPAWTDEGRWEPTDDHYRPTADDLYVPSPEDVAELEPWLDRLDTLHDLAERDAAADRLDALARLHAD